MQIKTPRLLLNEISIDDLNFIHTLHSIPEVDRYNTLGIPQNIEETRTLITKIIEGQGKENQKMYCWSIFKSKTNEPIGNAGLILSLDKYLLGEIFYKFLPDFWGKGYGTEVCKALIKSGFEDFNLHKVEAGVATGNMASVRVLEKSGMISEGIRRKILPIRGKWEDNYHFAIVEDDPRDY